MYKVLKVSANLAPMAAYAGSVDGILVAVGNAKSKSYIIGKYMDKTKAVFMVDSEAANESGAANIRHVYEWGDKQGQTSSIPLFTLIKEGRGDARYLSYDFLPSTHIVPLPDPEKSGISPGVLARLTPHIFRMKAAVMETQEHVYIAPPDGKALFIPAADQERGYIMTSRPVMVNPGGNSTGGFAKWWTEWFDTRAQEYIIEQAKKTEEFIAATGQTVIRDTTSGQFTTGTAVTFAYASGKQRAEEIMAAAISMEYDT